MLWINILYNCLLGIGTFFYEKPEPRTFLASNIFVDFTVLNVKLRAVAWNQIFSVLFCRFVNMCIRVLNWSVKICRAYLFS